MTCNSYSLKHAFICITAIAISSCSGSRESFETIDPASTELTPSQTRLELPPDLLSTSSKALTTEALTEDDVVPEILGVTTHENENERWLEIDAPAEEVWPKLVEYWAVLGASLVVSDPQTGIMETNWVHQQSEEKSKGLRGSNLLVSLLSRITDEETSLEKYTLRIERKENSTTLVYLGHRGSKKIQIGTSSIARDPEWEWVETGEDKEKVRTILQSISYRLDPAEA